MLSKRVEFELVPQALNTVSVLGSLVFDKRKELGPKAWFELTEEANYQPLARDFIASLYQHSKADRIAHEGSIAPYSQAIRLFLAYCHEAKKPFDFRMCDINFDVLLDFRAHVRIARTGHKGGTQRRLYGNLQRLLEAGQEIELANADLVPPRNFLHTGDSDVTQPYSAYDALTFEDACRTCIQSLAVRLRKGQELLAEGKDPRRRMWVREPQSGKRTVNDRSTSAWNLLPNMLWYVVNVMDGECLSRNELQAEKHSTFVNATTGALKGPFRKPDVYSHLYVLTEDLIPFIVLLAKKTGRNESSILTLRRDCIEQVGDRFYLWYEKDRGVARRYKKPIDNSGPFSPVQLIQTLLELTKPLQRLANIEHRAYLFLGLTVRAGRRDSVKPLDPTYVKFQMNREGGWCDRNDLNDEHGRPLRISLRRWRVFYLCRKYRTHGQLGRVTRDAAHTLANTTVGYLNNDSTKHIHELSIQAGIQSARDLARIVVIPEGNHLDAAATLKVEATHAAEILSGELDVLFASCKDFYNRPGGPPNTPCGKPWECLLCSNAVITRHVLPRVLAFRNFMQERKGELPISDWRSKFEKSWIVLTNSILPKFSDEVIAEAERQLQTESLYLPLVLKV